MVHSFEEQQLPAPASLRRLAVSESGFIFDPTTGRSFTANETGVSILRALQAELGIAQIRQQLAADYEVAPQTLDRDLSEFLASLRAQIAR